MTDQEFLEVAKSQMYNNGNVTRTLAKKMYFLLKQSPRRLAQAHALFGDLGLYVCTTSDIQNFMYETEFNRSELDKNNYSKFDEVTKKTNRRSERWKGGD